MVPFRNGWLLQSPRSMKQKLAIVLLIVLFAGAIVRPMLHLGHCHSRVGGEGHHKARHHSSSCAICKFISEPTHVADPQTELHASPAVYILIALSPRLVFAAVPGGFEQARGPPVG